MAVEPDKVINARGNGGPVKLSAQLRIGLLVGEAPHCRATVVSNQPGGWRSRQHGTQQRVYPRQQVSPFERLQVEWVLPGLIPPRLLSHERLPQLESVTGPAGILAIR